MRKLRQLKLDNCDLLFLSEYGKWSWFYGRGENAEITSDIRGDIAQTVGELCTQRNLKGIEDLLVNGSGNIGHLQGCFASHFLNGLYRSAFLFFSIALGLTGNRF